SPACRTRVPSPRLSTGSFSRLTGDPWGGNACEMPLIDVDAASEWETLELRLRLPAHQRAHRDPRVQALVAHPLDLRRDRHLHVVLARQVADREAALHALRRLPRRRLRL